MITDFTGKGAFYNVRGLAFILIFLFLFNIIFYFIGVFSAGLIYHLSFFHTRDLLSKPDGSALAINISRLVSVVSLIGYMFLPVLLFSIINRVSLVEEGNLKSKLHWQPLYIALLVVALCIPLVDSITEMTKMIPLPKNISYWAAKFEISREATVSTILDMHALPELFACLFIVGLVPAFFEELMFRGAMLNIFKNISQGIWKPIILQALVFGVLHFSFYQLPGILFMGIVFGWIAIKTGTIWYGVVMHFLFNATTIVLQYLNHLHFDKTGINGRFDNLHFSPIMSIAALFGIVLLLRVLNHNLNNKISNG